MRPLIGNKFGAVNPVDPFDLLFGKRQIMLDSSFAASPARKADAQYCLACLRLLDDRDYEMPVWLHVSEVVPLIEDHLELAQAMRADIRSPIRVVAQCAGGMALLVVTAGKPGYRFVRPFSSFSIGLNRLDPRIAKVVERYEAYGEIPADEADDGDDMEDPENEMLRAAKKNPERFKMIKYSYDELNERVVQFFAECGGERAIPFIERLRSEDIVFLTPSLMIAYGLADHVLTKETRDLCYGPQEAQTKPNPGQPGLDLNLED